MKDPRKLMPVAFDQFETPKERRIRGLYCALERELAIYSWHFCCKIYLGNNPIPPPVD